MMQTPTTVPVVRIVLLIRVVAKLPSVQAVGKFSKTGESGGPRGLRPISALDFSELKTELQRTDGESASRRRLVVWNFSAPFSCVLSRGYSNLPPPSAQIHEDQDDQAAHKAHP